VSPETIGLVLLLTLFAAIFAGFPIAFTLIILALVFGYVEIGLQVFQLMVYQFFGIMQDTSAGAGLPSLGEVAVIITAITLIFFVLLALAFSISGLARGPASESGGDTHSPEALTHGGRA